MENIDIHLFNKFRDYMMVYLPKMRSKSAKTIETYRTAINLFNEFIEQRDGIQLFQITIKDYTASNILEFMDWLQLERKNSESTINQRLFALRSFCKYLMKDNPILIPELSHILDIEKRTVMQNRDFIFLEHKQLSLLFHAPDISTKYGIRDRFFLELMYDSGCRDDEILSLQVKNFVIDNDKICINVVGKGSKIRLIPITQKILPAYRDYQKAYLLDSNPDDFMFYTIRHGIKTKMSYDNVARFMAKYEKELKKIDPYFPHLHPHLLRRSRAMNLYIGGVPLPIISDWLGHSQIETTTIYAQATTEMKRRAAEKADSRNSTIFTEDVFEYANDKEILQRLYGLK